MYIEDEELRLLYRDASQDHLDKLEAGVLHLEQHSADTERLKELLREAHSLKGDSRMLGVQDAETLTHHVEELLIAVDKGECIVTAELCDRLYQGLDAIRKIAHEAVTGDASGVSVFHTLAQLAGEEESSPALFDESAIGVETETDLSEENAADLDAFASNQPYVPAGLDLSMLDPELVAELQGVPVAANGHDTNGHDSHALLTETNGHSTNGHALPIETNGHSTNGHSSISETPEPSAPQDATPKETDSYQIDTVRVAATKLDLLITQASELAVTKLRIARRTDDITQILNLWENWSRENATQRTLLDHLAQQVEPELLSPLQETQHRHQGYLEQFGDLIRQLRGTATTDTARLDTISNSLESGILKLRMLPLSSLFGLFPRLVRDLAKDQSKDIHFVIEGGDTLADKRILEEMKAPLTHLIRNAIDHGIEPLSERLAAGKANQATLGLRGYQVGSSICIELVDDGRGLDLDKIKCTALRRGLYSEAELDQMSPDQIQSLIFQPGFSTRTTVTELSGRGVGLDVVHANVERLKGTIQVSSTPGQGCTFRLMLGASLTTTNVLIVSVDQTPYAIPVEAVDTMIQVQRQDIYVVDDSPTVTFEDQPLSLVWLADLLELPTAASPPQRLDTVATHFPCVVLTVGTERLGVLVDQLVEMQDIVLKPLSRLLHRVRNVTGATILGNGEICMVLNPQDLVRAVRGERALSVNLENVQTKPKVLLVEDSIPIRTQVRRILQGAGYDVTAAVDGLDGFEKLSLDAFDAVVSDIEMPNLTGLELTSRIRQQDEYEELPIILVSTLAKEEDRRRGADAGANAYITKGDFDQTLLLDTLRRLI
ncbi:hybrid sensor histidine kinase/response regulator [Acaryochloris sp. IP29b_bin.148]|uniref:hybrid sensor histidine kinase/response regulator n=1 Tax=Acaryochloris sp. IP29b_bin.148 TaxID=2969218 RepID=UPI00261C3380|nr:hybrid sensor histidine kinase/response regulator [Acaryochloris sp. IP29b_bin.148]